MMTARQEKARHAPDAGADLGYALSLHGTTLAALGRKPDAIKQWQRAAELIDAAPPRPNRMAERAMLALKLGDQPTATRLQRQLATYGYRRPDYIRAIEGVAR